MLQSVGLVDRAIRVVAGAALIGVSPFAAIGPWSWIGVIPMATGIFWICPDYLPFGLSTCTTQLVAGSP